LVVFASLEAFEGLLVGIVVDTSMRAAGRIMLETSFAKAT
jgi:hypothetical protein